VDSIARTRENAPFLPGVVLPFAIAATGELAAAARAEALLIAVPAQHLRASLALVAAEAPEGIPLVVCAKGIEQASGKLVTEVFRETAPAFSWRSSPGRPFARDARQGLPTAVTIAARFESPSACRRVWATQPSGLMPPTTFLAWRWAERRRTFTPSLAASWTVWGLAKAPARR